MAAQFAAADAVTAGTTAKQAAHWRHYLEYLADLELADDPFLHGLDDWARERVVGAFANAYRTGRFSRNHDPAKGPAVVSDTVRAAIDAVAATYRVNHHRSPCHDAAGRLAYVLQRQLKGYKNADPSPTPQKALPPSIYREMAAINGTEADVATHQLLRGALFFAMRSCEYLKVSGARRTKLLRLKNIRFFRRRRELPHDHPELHLATSVSITFEYQKNDERDVTITMHHTGDPVLCPVVAWSEVVRRVRGYPGTTDETSVCTIRKTDGTLGELTSKIVLTKLRARVRAIGVDQLGFTDKEIGTHSVRSSAAMSMYLASVPVFTIMLIGRWSSDAFLRYIRRQVQEFSSGVSRRMIVSEDFYTIPETANHEDPRAPGDRHNFSARSHIGLDAQRNSAVPPFALHY